MKLLRVLARLPRLLLIGLVKGYQQIVSPLFPSTCRFHPTCSAYAVQAFRTYGAAKGLVLTLYRIARCHPWGGHGYDPPRWFNEPPPSSHT
ncbi:membrane protein insertion efficiency factor YidD [Salisaeta longa]|uniref:membrane protein insertion efficiency factor YidD n=1 Tax=Salisaeta longa TaxID=503170 RepID=UPI0003B3933A|nr:membrane protein insertion efficiency factor YidD [Salisaeta longa]